MIFNAQTDAEYAADLRQRALQCSRFAKMYASMAAYRREQHAKMMRRPMIRTAERANHAGYAHEYALLAHAYIDATLRHLHKARSITT